MCSGARLALLVCGIIMHSSVYCSPDATGLPFPGFRSEEEAYDEDGNLLQKYYTELPGTDSPAPAYREADALHHPREMRGVLNLILDKAYRKVLAKTSRKKLLRKLVASGLGSVQRKLKEWTALSNGQRGFRSGSVKGDSDPLSKRHSDGIFTDSYSRYRKQMAVRKYLAAVLGKRYKQRVKNKGRRIAYL